MKYRGFKRDGVTFVDSSKLPPFQNGLALVGAREIAALLTRAYWNDYGDDMPVYNEIVSYGVATNRYMAYQALQMRLLDNCIMLNGCSVTSSDCNTSSPKDLHLAAACVEAIVGAVWADSQDLPNSADIVAGVMRQFNIYFPRAGVEMAAMRRELNRLRAIGFLRSVGSAPEKGFFGSANC
ncbi:uncharacterized protein CLAFUR5_04100 [Fulvia fulva]|uniref:Uncharacterized protein n=1 Tax=Passalora fulva TaxID=5499 RepID=A0A9Q8LGH2_PASFU|nr:uncharacterized protein CLAFUR5_04100 [Fulvia fulva]KAK4628266.1 hypothetical protein CLAFUR0_04125 [Fulvia fulva]UJO16960.1 hypothetical protein CLAFUR5_04100 [Fulvia fulva]